jgi:hypothetical protein
MTGFSPPNPNAYYIADFPGSYHANGGALSFADGHSDIHRWRDPRTMPPLVYQGTIWDGQHGGPSPRNVDIGYLQDHATRPTQ